MRNSPGPAPGPLPGPPAGPPPRYWALRDAVLAERERRQKRAVLTSTLVALLAAFTFGASVLPVAVTGNLVLGYLLFLVVQGTALALVLIRTSGGEYRKALIVGEFGRRASYASWKEATGEDAPPLDPQAAADFLARHGEDDELLMQRLHAQINAGDRAGAHATLARYPRETPEQRYAHASDAWFLGFLDGSDAPPDAVAALAAELEDEDKRIRAAAAVAALRAFLAAARGVDWIGPMAEPYPLMAGRITDDWRLPYVVRTWVVTMAITSALVGAALLFARWSGAWPAIPLR
jgi:hypothetical protein